MLATNTSSLSVAAMAAGLEHPERVVGFHFFNPVAVLPLLEVVRGAATDDETVATALAVAKALKKNAVLVADATGFVVNRLLLRLMGEVIRGRRRGHAGRGGRRRAAPARAADVAVRAAAAGRSGRRPARGGDACTPAFGDRFPVSANLQALVAAGRPASTTGRPDGKPYVSDETPALLTVGDQPSTAEQVRERALTRWPRRAGLMLAEGVVAAPMDIDLCLILGAGWPFHLGGITPVPGPQGIVRAGPRPPVPAAGRRLGRLRLTSQPAIHNRPALVLTNARRVSGPGAEARSRLRRVPRAAGRAVSLRDQRSMQPRPTGS